MRACLAAPGVAVVDEHERELDVDIFRRMGATGAPFVGGGRQSDVDTFSARRKKGAHVAAVRKGAPVAATTAKVFTSLPRSKVSTSL